MSLELTCLLMRLNCDVIEADAVGYIEASA